MDTVKVAEINKSLALVRFTKYYKGTKSRRMRWADMHAGGQMGNAYKILIRKPEGKTVHSENLGLDGRIISEWILEKQGGKFWTGLIWLR
jgi:hypothetical protein